MMLRQENETLTEFVCRWMDAHSPRLTTSTAKPHERPEITKTDKGKGK